MKKVVICINSAWAAYNFRLNLARALKNIGCKVIFLAPKDNEYSKKIEHEFYFYNLDIDPNGINPINDFKTLISLHKLYKTIKPDIVLNFSIKANIYSSIVCGFVGVKTISNISGLGTIFIKESFVTKIAKFLYKVALKNNIKVFFQNKDDKKLFIDNNLVQEIQTDLLAGSGVDLEKFKVIKKEKNSKFTFLLIARLLKDKGVFEYIEAIKIIKQNYQDVEFQILGEIGSKNKTSIPKEEVNTWIKDGLINYLGVSDNVSEIIAQSDCIVLPSYREGTPRSLLEAAAMAKPIVTTNVVGCKEVVDDGVNGYLCEVKNAQDLSAKMIKMLNLSDETRELMGNAGREKIIEKFDEKIVVDKYIEAINEI